MNRKEKIFSLIEYYLNDFQGEAVEEIYGKGSKIKIHNITYSTHHSSIMVEAVIILGETITEEYMDRKLADILIQDALLYFYPDKSIKAYVRFDV